MYTRILADTLNSHECGIDCVPTPDGRHILYPALPTIDAGRYQWELNRGMTRAQYRASGQDETRECRVWSAQRAAQISADRAAARLSLYLSGRESSQDDGRGL